MLLSWTTDVRNLVTVDWGILGSNEIFIGFTLLIFLKNPHEKVCAYISLLEIFEIFALEDLNVKIWHALDNQLITFKLPGTG